VSASKRPLAAIAIVLAVIAVGMLAFAIWYRRTRTERAVSGSRDAQPATAPVDAAPPDEGTIQFIDPWARDDSGVAPDPTTCQPCGATCGQRCTCKDGSTSTSWSCSNGCCSPPDKTCDEVCASRGGVR
jgi:hypothetical protein